MYEPCPLGGSSPSSSFDASKVVVIQPGSLWLRIGTASQPGPITVPHLIARRRKQDASRDYHYHWDSSCVKAARLGDDTVLAATVGEARQHALQDLHSTRRFAKRTAPTATEQQVRALNSKAVPLSTQTVNVPWLELSADKEFVTGQEALRVAPAKDYNLHYPFKRGDVHLHSEIGGSQTSILADLRCIWSTAIKQELGIPLDELGQYRAVLIIPALYKRALIKHFIKLLLVDMAFEGCFVLQDHVAATFGAGLGYACVVDVGAEKTSISCVEDAISHPETRIHLDYGGSDVLLHLAKGAGFTYPEYNASLSAADAELIRRLKEQHCHLDSDLHGVEEIQFCTPVPGQMQTRHTCYLGDERIIAPSAFFYTGLLAVVEGSNGVRFMGKDVGDPEDPHDQNYVADTSRKYTKPGTGGPTDVAGDALEDFSVDMIDENSMSIPSVSQSDEATAARASAAATTGLPGNLLPLDQAIVQSIENCPTLDLKRKMYSCILIVGGGFSFKGAVKYLRQKLAPHIPSAFRSDPSEIITHAKDMNSTTTAWKGAAVLSCLDSAQELWITKDEWEKNGQRLLREKAPFPWT